MKKIFRVLVLAVIIFVLTSFAAAAESEESFEYIISESDGEYLLSAFSGGVQTPVIKTKSISEICKYIDSVPEGAMLFFKGITLYDDISLESKRLCISGDVSFVGDSSFAVSGTEVIADGMTMNFDTGALFIKNGTFILDNSEINAKNTAIRIDYSASASAYLKSGKVVGNSLQGTVICERGSCNVYSASVFNSSGAAIRNSSTLILSPLAELNGTQFDVYTDTQVTFSGEKQPFSYNLRVKYAKTFEKGTLSCVFYSATEEMLFNVSLIDASGALQPVRYFDFHEMTRERNFGAVYLPYKVNFYRDGILTATEECVGGESVKEEDASDKIGYEFVGWTLERDGDNYYDFAKKVNSDLNLHAKYRLTPPSFSLSSLEFTYDGREHSFGITKLEHPLLDSGIISYLWHRNGEYISDAGPELKLSEVSESGEYACTFSFTFGIDTVSVKTPAVSVKIKKAAVSLPEDVSKPYNGEYQRSGIASTTYYTSEESGGVDVGSYPVLLTLADGANFEFADGASTAYVDFKIVIAENFWLEEPMIFDVYQGMVPEPVAKAAFGSVIYRYSEKYDGVFVDAAPKVPGDYYCKAFVSGCKNYSELYSEPIKFSVIEEVVCGISISNMPEKVNYTAFESFVADGLCLSVTYNSSRVEVIESSKITFSYQTADNFRYGDKAIIATYLGRSVAVPVTVAQAEYDISGLIFESESKAFCGFYQSLGYDGVLPVGLDGIALTATVSGGGVNAGDYSVTLAFFSESPNYRLPADIERTLTVLPCKSEAVFPELSFVYSGDEVCPSGYYLDIFGRKKELRVEGGRSLVGEYEALLYTDDPNYVLDAATVRFSILKADYDFSSVSWVYGDYVYDGYEKSVYLQGLPDGVSVIGYSDSTAISAGKYLARAAITYDEHNYNAPPELSFEWEIKKAEYDISGLEFCDAEWVYDGLTHYPTLRGEMPVGADGIRLEYYFSAGAVNVSDGRVPVKISFETESTNYNLPKSTEAYVQILPLGINVRWEELDFVYDLSSHAPRAYSELCSVSVLGAMTDAGEYTATAILSSDNYYVINPTVNFTIQKAENFWSKKLEINDIYEGESLSPYAECISGEVVYLYYTSSGAELDEPPLLPGDYYVRAHSEGSRNYKAITSDAVRFKIVKVIPVSILAELIKTEYKAFDVIGADDITVTVIYNNGASSEALFDNALISYEKGDSLRFGDSHVEVSYLGFSETVEVSVKKADYDMSGLSWSGDSFVYDGSEKRVLPTELPQGLSVKEIIGCSGIKAGEYTAKVLFDYDADNYNSPGEIEYRWRIEKRVVEAPVLENLVYNGSLQEPIFTKSELYTIVFSPQKNVGTHSALFVLRDLDNYEFITGEGETFAYYTISPKVITVKLSDVEDFLFSDMPEPEYTIVDGHVESGDELGITFIYSENEVRCESSNQNYSIRVIPGRVVRHNRLSEKQFFDLFVLFAMLTMLTVAVVIVIRKRREIAHSLYLVRCRLSPTVKNKEESDISHMTEETLQTDKVGVAEDVLSVDAERANSLISDSLAKNLVRKNDERIESDGNKKRIINVDTLSENFSAGERVDVNILKTRNLVPSDTAYIKVLARGAIDKPLKVYANDFSLSAVKMIALSGGESFKVVTVRSRKAIRRKKS